MLNRYKVKLIKRYDFELDGISEESVKEQVDYIMTQTNLLDMPYVEKRVHLKIKKINEKEKKNNEKKS